jgi:hypothetical protein
LRPDNISEETFAKVALFESWFEDKTVDLKDAEHWFQVDVLGVGEPQTEEQTTHPDTPPNTASMDVELIDLVRKKGASEKRISQMLDSGDQPPPPSHSRWQTP